MVKSVAHDQDMPVNTERTLTLQFQTRFGSNSVVVVVVVSSSSSSQ